MKLAMGRERGVKGGLVSLRIGSVNVSTMKKKDGVVVDMAARRRLDFCCLQETGWKGEGARKFDGGEGNCREDCAELDFCICAAGWKPYAGEGIILHLIGEDCVRDR